MCVDIVFHALYCMILLITLLGLQTRFEDKLLEIRVNCPENGPPAVLKGLTTVRIYWFSVLTVPSNKLFFLALLTVRTQENWISASWRCYRTSSFAQYARRSWVGQCLKQYHSINRMDDDIALIASTRNTRSVDTYVQLL